MAVRRHLATCAECTASLATYDAVLATLGSATQPGAPPAALRGRILGGTSRTASVTTLFPRVDDPGLTALIPTEPTPTEPVPTGADPTAPHPGPDRRRRHLGRRLTGALLAAACAVVVGGLAGQAVTDDGSGLDRAVAGLARPGGVHSTLHDENGTPVAAVVAAPGVLEVVVADLPANDPARSVYVLWGIGAGAPRALGTFDSDARGTDVVALPPATSGAVGYAVSLEPGRTAPAAPSRVVASGQLA
jgi:hypothetical protein